MVTNFEWKRRLARFGLALALALGVLQPPPAARADWHSVTGLFPPFTDQTSEGGEFSPDGQYLVYVADAEIDGVEYLYSAPVAGGAPVRLNPDLESTGGVQHFAISADGSNVIYSSAVNSRALTKIFRVPIAGGASVQISGDASMHGSAGSFRLDPGSGTVVYAAPEALSSQPALYSVPIAGGTPVKVSGSVVSGGVIVYFLVDPIADRVIYLANAEDVTRYELYSAPRTGGAVVKLSPAGAAVGVDFQLHPSLAVVAFTAIPNGSTQRQLYRNGTAGGALSQLNVSLSAGKNVESFAFTPDGTKVVYGVSTGPQVTDHVRGDLYAVAIGGGASTPLSVPTDPSLGAGAVYFAITPDSQRVILNYRLSALLAPEIQSVAIDGTDRQTLYTQSGSVQVAMLEVSHDGQWVLFQDSWAQTTLRLPIGGGGATPLNISSFPLYTGDGQRAISLAIDPAKGQNAAPDLYSVGIADLSRRNLTTLEPGAALDEWSRVGPDGSTIAYVVVHTYGADTRREIRLTDGDAGRYLLSLPVIRK